jgi:glucosyl-3-phosphoglycerate phosphatase
MRLLLVRHGQSAWNAARRLQGQADVPLSDLGRDQARRLAPVIGTIGPCRAITSDLGRATETAEILGGATATPQLREIAVGDWTGAEIETLTSAEHDNYHNWRAGSYAPPGGELWSDFRARVAAVIDAEAARPCANLLVVCHGGVIRALIEHLLGLAPRHIIPVGPASLTAICLTNLGPRLELFNYRPDLPEFAAPD